MKRSLLLLLLLVAAVSSCDYVRIFAGRPTAAQLEQKKQHIQDSVLAARQKAAADSVQKAAIQAAPDTLAILDSLRQLQIPIHGKRRIGGVAKRLDHRYFVIVGAFSDPDNAARNCKKYEKEGYEAVVVPFANEFKAVAINPSDRITDVYRTIRSLQGNGFCPSGTWILINE